MENRTEKTVRDTEAPVNGLFVLYQKEMTDHIRSRRFLIILGIIVLTCLAGIYGVSGSMKDAAEKDSAYLFLKLFTLSGNSIPSFASFVALLGPFVGLTLGFDAVNSERNEGTLNRLVSQPIHRDTVINGKFLAGAALIFLMVFSMGLLLSAFGILVFGITPSSEEVGRIFVFLLFTAVYMSFWLALSIFFSTVCRHTATSAMSVIAVWMFCALFMSMAVRIVAGLLFPQSRMQTMGDLVTSYAFQIGMNRISPYYLYSEAVSTIMDPTVRSVSILMPEQLEGAVTGYLPLGQSLLLVWPHLTGLIAATAVIFAVSYVKFMRTEIRSR